MLDNLSADHAQPISQGGSFGIENVLLCCDRCNRTKGELTMEQFVALLDLMKPWHPKSRNSILSRLRAGGAYSRN